MNTVSNSRRWSDERSSELWRTHESSVDRTNARTCRPGARQLRLVGGLHVELERDGEASRIARDDVAQPVTRDDVGHAARHDEQSDTRDEVRRAARHEEQIARVMAPQQAPEPQGELGSPDTADLVGLVARGDEAAFSELYRRASSFVFGVALRVTRDSVLAQDVLQETFLQVWREAHRFDPVRGSARSWMLTIAHRRAVDRVRHEQTSHVRETAWALRSLDRDHDSVAEIVELRAEHRRVRTALESLSQLQREAVELAYVRGMTHTEVADELGIPLGTAKTRIRDGLLKLRESIGATA